MEGGLKRTPLVACRRRGRGNEGHRKRIAAGFMPFLEVSEHN